MAIDNLVNEICSRFRNICDYEGDRIMLKNNLQKTVIGSAAILGLNALNAPEILEIVAYGYTIYHGFKAYKDLQKV